MTGVALRMTGVALRMTGAALRMTGAVLRMTGAALRMTGAALRMTGAVLRITGFTFVILSAAKDLRAQEQPNEVHIIGERRDSEAADLPGRGVILTPQESTRQDLNALLSGESSIDFVDTGRVSASGFSVPRLRGHDSRSTEIWIDDFLIQDPLSGLPLIDEIDLRAFGRVKLLRGITPLSVHTAHQRGMIQFVPDFSGKSLRRQAGISYGRPHGVSGFGLVTQPSPSTGPAYRIFARTHTTRGDYPYYNDFATPYNTGDDITSTRSNNHRRSSLLTPFLRWNGEQSVLKISGFFARAESGVPARSPHLQSNAAEDNEQSVVSAGYSRQLVTGVIFAPDLLRLETHYHSGFNRIRNQSPDQFGYSGDREIRRRGGGSKVAAHWDFSRGSAEAALADQLTRITLDDSEPAVEAARAVTCGFGGADLRLPFALRLFQKFHLQQNTDRISDEWARDPSVSGGQSVSNTGRAHLTALAWSHDLTTVYLQAGENATLPSLLENFGDGGSIRPNLSLTPQRERHQEAGVTLSANESTGVTASVFQDDTRDRIVFLPSIGETSRAANLSRTSVRGYELQANAGIDWFEAAVSWTWLQPHSRLADGERRKIPGVAERQGTASIGARTRPIVARWQTRYRGDVWRDEDNTIQVPAALFHDLFLDTDLEMSAGEAKAGLSVLNLFDVRKTDIESPGHPDGRGATAVADLGGYPLPGRQIKITVEYLW
jgi:hypothetical protein